ncbi:transposable element Tcb1 transposase [Trichonephila clavipes]|uniref:Transposable element Tcb1 transposase n=1 Tax=Trichonephila clavipes TaxID=2585209 RepID=A0A8X6SI94_TRICX|nr:transposable element Tcb1 transposase [Trichonephila clavipes]
MPMGLLSNPGEDMENYNCVVPNRHGGTLNIPRTKSPLEWLVIGEWRRQRSAFDQVSEFDRGRIGAYRDCGLSFREIGSRVARNQTTVRRICGRWMQKGTPDRRGRSHPPQCTTSREDRQIVRMAVTDRSVTSRTVAQPIESVTHHSVCARNIGRRLQESGLSARRPLLGLPLTQNHRRLHRQCCDERRMWVAEWNEVVFNDEPRICLQHHDDPVDRSKIFPSYSNYSLCLAPPSSLRKESS